MFRKQIISLALCLMVVCCACTVYASDRPSYDQQRGTYVAQFAPFVANNPKNYLISPYFSPDHSIDTTTFLVGNATSSIFIAEPSFSSWSGCSYGKQCIGCSVEKQRNDAFPVFRALLNALHRGVSVTILTNYYPGPDCSGKISPLSFLALNGATVRYFTTVTFLHAKFMMVDNAIASISSVNWSKNSFMHNREAGVVIRCVRDCDAMFGWMHGVYGYDLKHSWAFRVNQTYSPSDMKIITDPSSLPYDLPPVPSNASHFITPTPFFSAVSGGLTIVTSPDYSHEYIAKWLSEVTTSFHLMIYQVTDEFLCDTLLDFHSKLGDNLHILVSQRILGQQDCDMANYCYQRLFKAGLTIHKTPDYYEYSHQKFWVADSRKFGMSTGNWSPEDFPATSNNIFPPYGHAGWQASFRDYTVFYESNSTEQHPVVSQFLNVWNGDMSRGSMYSPNAPVVCGY